MTTPTKTDYEAALQTVIAGDLVLLNEFDANLTILKEALGTACTTAQATRDKYEAPVSAPISRARMVLDNGIMTLRSFYAQVENLESQSATARQEYTPPA